MSERIVGYAAIRLNEGDEWHRHEEAEAQRQLDKVHEIDQQIECLRFAREKEFEKYLHMRAMIEADLRNIPLRIPISKDWNDE